MRLNPSIDEMAADAWAFAQQRNGSIDFRSIFAKMLSAYGYVIKKWGDAVATKKGRVVLSDDWEIVQL